MSVHLFVCLSVCLLHRLADALLSKADRNMKRETKAYSYEDQLWDAQLKEEMAKKKFSEQAQSSIRYWCVVTSVYIMSRDYHVTTQ